MSQGPRPSPLFCRLYPAPWLALVQLLPTKSCSAVLCFESDEGRSDSTLTPTSAHKATRTTDPGFDQEDQAHKLQHWLHLHHRQEPGQAAEECASCVGNSAFPCHALQKKKVEKRRLLHFLQGALSLQFTAVQVAAILRS